MIAACPRDPVYREGFNDSGGQLDAYKIVGGTREAIVYAAGVDTIAYGVVAQDIPDQEWGNIQEGGTVVVMAGAAGMTAGVLVMPEAGGTGLGVDLTGAAGDNKYVIGRCEKTAAAGKLGEVRWQPHLTQIAD